MKPEQKLAAIDRLLEELKEKINEYNFACNERAEIFEVKKKIRLRLKEIEKELNALRDDQIQISVLHKPDNGNTV